MSSIPSSRGAPSKPTISKWRSSARTKSELRCGGRQTVSPTRTMPDDCRPPTSCTSSSPIPRSYRVRLSATEPAWLTTRRGPRRGHEEADDGTRTHDLLHGKANRAVCADNGFSAKSCAEQALLAPPACDPLRSETAFCASPVRQTYGGVVARLANGQRSLHLGCICVSLPFRLRRGRGC